MLGYSNYQLKNSKQVKKQYQTSKIHGFWKSETDLNLSTFAFSRKMQKHIFNSKNYVTEPKARMLGYSNYQLKKTLNRLKNSIRLLETTVSGSLRLT